MHGRLVRAQQQYHIGLHVHDFEPIGMQLLCWENSHHIQHISR